MEYDYQLGGTRGNALGEQADNHNGNHRDIVEAGEDANDLPEAIGGKLQSLHETSKPLVVFCASINLVLNDMRP